MDRSSARTPVRFAGKRMVWLPCGLLGSLAILVCGCTSPREYVQNGFKVGPNYAKPAAPVEEKWIDTGHKDLVSRTPENIEWWKVLKDPVLDKLVNKAYQDNLTLRQAAFRVLQFQAQRAIAAGNLFPQTQQANASYSANAVSREIGNTALGKASATGGNIGGTAAAGTSRFFNVWDGGFNLAWELDFWGRLRRNLESADASLDASIEDYDNALVTLIGNVASTYVNIRTFQTRIELAKLNLVRQQKTFKIADASFEAGKTSKLERDQAITNLAQVESLIPQLEISERQAENQLCILLGMPPRDLENDLGKLKDGPYGKGSIFSILDLDNAPQLVVGIPADLLRRRPDVLSAERQAASQSAQIGVAQAELYPHISITGTISWQASRFQDLFNSQAMAGSVGPSLQWNVLNYGRLVNGVRIQDALFQQLVTNYQSVVLRAEGEVENGITSYLGSFKVVKALKVGVDAARDGLVTGDLQFTNGKIAFVALALLQQNLLTAEDQWATAYGGMVQSLIQTYQALGGGWQIRLSGNIQVPEELAAPVAPNQAQTNLAPLNQPVGANNPSAAPLARFLAPVRWHALDTGRPEPDLPVARIDVANVR